MGWILENFPDIFGEEITTIGIMDQFFSLLMGPKERIDDFNQRFTTLLNKIHREIVVAQELLVEAYANDLPTPFSMFVKWERKYNLAHNFEGEKNIELKMISCKQKHNALIEREIFQTKKNVILLKTSPKDVIDPKEN